MTRLRKGATATVTTYPPQVPSTVTATVIPPTGGEPEALTVTADAVATTLTASAIEGAKSLAVTSATGITVGRFYEVDTQTVEVESVSGLAVNLTNPLQGPVSSSASFSGRAYTADLTAVHTAEEGFGLVKWTSDLDTWDQQIEIRVQTADAWTLNASSLVDRFSMAHDLRDPDDPNFSKAIRAGWYLLERDLASLQINKALIRSWAELEDAHAHATILALVNQSPRYDDEARGQYEGMYENAKAAAFNSRSMWYDANDDGTKDEGERIVKRISWAL